MWEGKGKEFKEKIFKKKMELELLQMERERRVGEVGKKGTEGDKKN